MFRKVQSFFILFIVCTNSIFAMNYDDDILSMYAKLSPRIVLLSSTKENLKDTLEICLLHESSDEQTASTLQDKMLNNYKNGIKNYRLDIKKVLYTKLDECANSNMLFLLATDEAQLQKSIQFSRDKKILTISYDSKALESGADISLFIGRKILPYLNVRTIQNKGIELESMLFRISKIYNLQAKGDN